MSTASVLIEWGDGTSDTYIVTKGSLFTVPTHTYAVNGTYTPKVTVFNGTLKEVTVDTSGANSIQLTAADLSQAAGVTDVTLKAAGLDTVTLGSITQAQIQSLTIEDSTANLKVDSGIAGKADVSGLPNTATFTLKGNTGLTEVIVPSSGFASADLSGNALTGGNVAAIVDAAAAATVKPTPISMYGQSPLAAVRVSQAGLGTLVLAGKIVNADIAIATTVVQTTAVNQTISQLTNSTGTLGDLVVLPNAGAATTQNIAIGAAQTTTTTYTAAGTYTNQIVQKFNPNTSKVTGLTLDGNVATTAKVQSVNAAGAYTAKNAGLTGAVIQNHTQLATVNFAKATDLNGDVTATNVSQKALTAATVNNTAISDLDLNGLTSLTSATANLNSGLVALNLAGATALVAASFTTNNFSKGVMDTALVDLNANVFSGSINMIGQLTNAKVDNTNTNMEALIKRGAAVTMPCDTGFTATVNITNFTSLVDIQFTLSSVSGTTFSVVWETGGVAEIITSTGAAQTVSHNYTSVGVKNITVTGVQGFTSLTLQTGTGLGTGTLNKWTSINLDNCVFLTLLNATGQALTSLSIDKCYPLITATFGIGNTLDQTSVNNLFINLNSFGFLTGTVVTTGSPAPTGTGLTAKNALTTSPKTWSIT